MCRTCVTCGGEDHKAERSTALGMLGTFVAGVSHHVWEHSGRLFASFSHDHHES